MCSYACTSACSVVSNFATPWTVAPQALLSMEFSKQEYRSGLPFSTPGDLPNLGIELESLTSPLLAGRFSSPVPPRKLYCSCTVFVFLFLTYFTLFNNL